MFLKNKKAKRPNYPISDNNYFFIWSSSFQEVFVILKFPFLFFSRTVNNLRWKSIFNFHNNFYKITPLTRLQLQVLNLWVPFLLDFWQNLQLVRYNVRVENWKKFHCKKKLIICFSEIWPGRWGCFQGNFSFSIKLINAKQLWNCQTSWTGWTDNKISKVGG